MKNLFLLCLLVLGVLKADSQSFLEPFELFSGKKTSYINLMDGSAVEGNIGKVKRKKGLLASIQLKMSNGKKVKYKPKDIREMYLPPSSFERMGRSMEAGTNVRKISRGINSDHIREGYAYFANTEVLYKGKREILLMQLLNPESSSIAKVFHDPRARETTRVGVGAFTVGGGDDKSYYVQVGDKTAVLLRKKDYTKEFNRIYKDCPEVIEKYKSNIKWSEFAKHLHECAGILEAE